jgi:hypothetical protein
MTETGLDECVVDPGRQIGDVGCCGRTPVKQAVVAVVGRQFEAKLDE